VVIPWDEDLVRDERPLPLTGVRPPPPTLGVTPSLQETKPDPEVQTSTEGGAPSRENGEGTVTGGPKAPPVELDSPLVSSQPPLLERGQRTRQPPTYLKDFVCDCVQSGTYKSLERNCTGKPSDNCKSCEPHVNINLTYNYNYNYNLSGGVVGGIITPRAMSSSHVQPTRCQAFSYADITKGRRVSKAHN